jgi:hypothetical protein
MKKQIGLRLAILILIGVMLLLATHTHPHHFYCCGEDDYCPLCQILNCGFTFTSSFELTLLLIVIGYITLSPLLAIKLNLPANYAGRAPPVNFTF